MATGVPDTFSFVGGMYHEIRAARRMVFDSLFVDNADRNRTRDVKATALILCGFLAPSFVYNNLAAWIRSLGIAAEVADYGWLNIPSFVRQRTLLFESAEQFKKRYGAIDYVIGHSLGGVEAVALLPHYSEIKKVFTIASPLNIRKSPGLVEIVAAMFMVPRPLQRNVLASIKKKARRYASKIVTISSDHDKWCPPASASFQGKKNKKIGRHVSVGLFCRESICAYLMRSGRLFCRRNQNAMFIKKNSQRPFAV